MSVIAASYARRVTELALQRVDDLGSVRDEWNALAERAGNVFATHEWAAAWWEVYGEDRPLLVTACRDSAGRLVALLPLYLASRRPVRTLRFLGHGPADQLGPVCAPEDRQAAGDALRRLLTREFRGWDLLLAAARPNRGLGRPRGRPDRAPRGQPDARDRRAELRRVPRVA